MNPIEFEQIARMMVNTKPMSLREMRESGLIGRHIKYPYNRVVETLNDLQGNDINEDMVEAIIYSGWLESGKHVGKKKIYGLVKNDKVKEIIKDMYNL